MQSYDSIQAIMFIAATKAIIFVCSKKHANIAFIMPISLVL